MSLVAGIKGDGCGRTFRTRPEWGASRSGGVLGEIVKELLDVIRKLLLKLKTCPLNAFFKCQGLARHKVVLQHLQCSLFVTRGLQHSVVKVRVRKVKVDGLGIISEVALKRDFAQAMV